MAVTITAEEKVIDILKRVRKQEKDVSLLIGCKVSERHYHVLYIISPLINDSGSPKTSHWAYQVSSTLPGGVHVVGVATATEPKQLKTQLVSFGGILRSVWKRSQCGVNNWLELGGCPYSLLIYYSPETRKIRCMYIDASDTGSILQFPGGEVKTSSLQNLIQTQTQISFSLTHTVPLSTKVSQVLTNSVEECIERIDTSIGVLSNKYTTSGVPNGSDSVQSVLKSSSYKEEDGMIDVDLLMKEGSYTDQEGPTLISSGLKVQITDSIYCKAFIHLKTTWDDMIQALKLDAIKSLMIRKNTLLSELEEVEKEEKQRQGERKENEERKESHPKHFKLMFPRRLWFSNNHTSFSLTDHCFAEENLEEVIDNLRSIWGVNIDMIIESKCEEIKPGSLSRTNSSESTVSSGSVHSVTKLNNGGSLSITKSPFKLYIIAAMSVLLVAIILFMII